MRWLALVVVVATMGCKDDRMADFVRMFCLRQAREVRYEAFRHGDGRPLSFARDWRTYSMKVHEAGLFCADVKGEGPRYDSLKDELAIHIDHALSGILFEDREKATASLVKVADTLDAINALPSE